MNFFTYWYSLENKQNTELSKKDPVLEAVYKWFNENCRLLTKTHIITAGVILLKNNRINPSL